MNIIYFSSPSMIMQILSHLDKNIDKELINSAIYESQRIHLKGVLTSDLYKKIENDIENDTLTGIYQTIYEELQIPLAYWTNFELIPYISTKYTNQNLSQKSTENSNPSDLQREQYLRSVTEKKAQSVTTDLIDYLEENKLLIPEYKSSRVNVNEQFFTSVYTGNNLKSSDKYRNDNGFYTLY